MTKQEITDWIKNHRCIDHINEFTDGCGNYEVTKIYQDGEKLFAVDFFENHPAHSYTSKKGYDYNHFPAPREVIRKTRIVEETYYEPIEKL